MSSSSQPGPQGTTSEFNITRIVPRRKARTGVAGAGIAAVAVHDDELHRQVVQDVQAAQHVLRLVLDFGRIEHENDLGILRKPGIGCHGRKLETQKVEIAVERNDDRDQRGMPAHAIFLDIRNPHGLAKFLLDLSQGWRKNVFENLAHARAAAVRRARCGYAVPMAQMAALAAPASPVAPEASRIWKRGCSSGPRFLALWQPGEQNRSRRRQVHPRARPSCRETCRNWAGAAERFHLPKDIRCGPASPPDRGSSRRRADRHQVRARDRFRPQDASADFAIWRAGKGARICMSIAVATPAPGTCASWRTRNSRSSMSLCRFGHHFWKNQAGHRCRIICGRRYRFCPENTKWNDCGNARADSTRRWHDCQPFLDWRPMTNFVGNVVTELALIA